MTDIELPLRAATRKHSRCRIFEELANAFDQVSRFGFYPNFSISAAFSIAGARSPRGRLSEVGELVPSIVQTPLEAFVAAFPESEAAKFILETLLPNRFREYQVGLAVGSLGGDADTILDKRLTGISLTPEEEKMWSAGQREFAVGRGLVAGHTAPGRRGRPRQ